MSTFVIDDILTYLSDMGGLELAGLIFGLLNVFFLIRQSIKNWFFGILYILISFIIFWQSRLYGDFLLHIVYLVLNVYGWIHWAGKDSSEPLIVTRLSGQEVFRTIGTTVIGVILFAQLLIHIPSWFPAMEPASLPYWDSTTTIMSIIAMWLTTQKKIENWIYWLLIDILATGIYYYKELYFYSLLYFIYIFFAIWGLQAWRRAMKA